MRGEVVVAVTRQQKHRDGMIACRGGLSIECACRAAAAAREVARQTAGPVFSNSVIADNK